MKYLNHQPSCDEIRLFLKNSKPHMDVLHALPIWIASNHQSYLYENLSVFYKQYVFVDLERWELIELKNEFDVIHDGYSTTTVAKMKWQITSAGKQYLADIDYVGN